MIIEPVGELGMLVGRQPAEPAEAALPGLRPVERGRRWSALAVAAVAALIAGCAAGAILLAQGRSGRGASKPTGAVQLPAASSLQHMGPGPAFSVLMRAAAQSDGLLEGAASRACSTQPPGTSQRRALLQQVANATAEEVSLASIASHEKPLFSRLPGGGRLDDLFRQRTVISARLGRSYGSWLEDLQATGCYSAPTNDLAYREADGQRAALAPLQREVAAVWRQAGRLAEKR